MVSFSRFTLLTVWSLCLQAGFATISSFGADVSQPMFSGGQVHWILERGESAVLAPIFTGTRPFTVQWQKDGRVLAGKSLDTLPLSVAKPADAGEYEIRVSNASGSAMTKVQVAVFDFVSRSDDNPLPVRSDAPIRLITSVWGPGSVIWGSQYGPNVFTPNAFSSRYRPTLRVFAPDAVVSSGMEADLVLGPVSRVISQYTLVEARAPRINNAPQGWRFVGEGEQQPIVLDSYNPTTPIHSATGLPEGVTLTPEGVIQGNYSKAGVYRITWKASNDYGVGTLTTELRITYNQPDYPMPGTYVGLLTTSAESPDFNAPTGSIQLQVQSSGAFTGQFRSRGRTYPLAGRFTPEYRNHPFNGAQVPLGNKISGAQDAFFAIDLPSIEEGRLYVRMGDTRAGELIQVVEGDVTRVNRPTALVRQTQTGTFSGLLKNDTLRVLGTGIASLNIAADGSVATGMGTLPDGTGFTFGTALAMDHDDNPSLPVYHTDLATKNTLFGWMPVTPNSRLIWKRAPQPRSRLYPEGFQFMLSNKFLKRRPLDAGELLLSDCLAEPLNAQFKTNFTGLLLNVPFTLTSAHRAVFSPNLNRVSLDFYAPTGFFTGRFGAGSPVHFRGMMLPGLNEGGGFFLLPLPATPDSSPPTTSANSPIYSGTISILPLRSIDK